MASQTAGRFKKFNAVQNVSSLSEIREVFDTVILWVVEGMELIDSNQHRKYVLYATHSRRSQGVGYFESLRSIMPHASSITPIAIVN